jgi:hypothetical protein
MVHPDLHVYQLKAFTPDHTPVHHQLPNLPQLDILDVVPEQIVDRSLVKRGNEAVTQILIKWSGLPVSSGTWKDYYFLQRRFPLAPIWGSAAS